MARRGRFGLQPRVQQGIGGTLLSIAREMQSKRDSNIMDAWRNGGTFTDSNGRTTKATDESVLAYWRDREKDLSKDDPNFNAISNNIMQLTYGIEQSKIDLKHLQGKVSDAQYAQFFIRWSNKVPKDSEFYRTLQKDAAQLMESAKAKGRANADKAKSDAFNAFVSSTQDKFTAVGDGLLEAAQAMATSSGLNLTGNGDQVLSLLTTDIKTNPDKYHALLDSIHKADPGWDGQITHGFFASSIKAADHGYSIIADRAKHDGYASAYAQATKNQSNVAAGAADLQVWPIAQSYNTAYNTFSRTWNDPQASQMDKQEAAKVFAAATGKLAATPGLEPQAVAMLTADAKRLNGDDAGDLPSFGALIGHPGIDAKTADTAAYYKQTSDLMQKAPGSYVWASVDANGAFDPTGEGGVGAVPAGALPAGFQMVAVPSLHGSAMMVAVVPHSVYAKDPNDPSADPKLVGFSLSYNVGSKTVNMYSYGDDKGAVHWRLSPPWADGAVGEKDKKGDTYITLKTPDPLTRAAAIDAKYGTHLVEAIKAGSTAPTESFMQRDANGHETGKTTITFKDGAFSATVTSTQFNANGQSVGEQTAPLNLNDTYFSPASAIAPSVRAAGPVPGTTFDSPLAASMKAAAVGLSSSQVSLLTTDPTFQQSFLQQTMQVLGINNPLDPRVNAAWKAITATTPTGGLAPDERVPQDPKARDDLQYPGRVVDPANQGSLTLDFGKQQLKVPGLPSYLQGSANLAPLGDLAKLGGDALGAVLGGIPGIAQTNPLANTPGTVTPTTPFNTGGPSTAAIKPPTITPTAPINTGGPSTTQIASNSPLTAPTGNSGSNGYGPRPRAS